MASDCRKDLQRLNCGFPGGNLDATKLLVKCTSTSIKSKHTNTHVSWNTKARFKTRIQVLTYIFCSRPIDKFTMEKNEDRYPIGRSVAAPFWLIFSKLNWIGISWSLDQVTRAISMTPKKIKRDLSTSEFSILRLRWYPTTDWLHSYRVKRAICATLTNEMGGVQLCSCSVVQLCSCACS